MRFSPLNLLLYSQFLSAFVDNMILFLVRGILIRDQAPDSQLFFVQGVFLLSYVVLAPIVGAFADRNPKAKVLLIGNGIKALGVLVMMLGVNPAWAYGIVGIGAVVYSPAKYGILPWLTKGEGELLKANAHLESATILAILLGTVVGGYLADISIVGGLIGSGLLYLLSILIAWYIPKDLGNEAIQYGKSVKEFFSDTVFLFKNRGARFSLIGTGSFWMATAVLRMILLIWIPLVLGISEGSKIGMIVGITGIGIGLGAVATPYLVSLEKYYKTLFYGFGMGLMIFAFLGVTTLWQTGILLLITGFLGGVYIVPMNACLQKEGNNSIGAGKTIAIQNLIENSFMLFGMATLTQASHRGFSVFDSIWGIGLLFLGVIALMAVVTFMRKGNEIKA